MMSSTVEAQAGSRRVLVVEDELMIRMLDSISARFPNSAGGSDILVARSMVRSSERLSSAGPRPFWNDC